MGSRGVLPGGLGGREAACSQHPTSFQGVAPSLLTRALIAPVEWRIALGQSAFPDITLISQELLCDLKELPSFRKMVSLSLDLWGNGGLHQALLYRFLKSLLPRSLEIRPDTGYK